ncbi:MAG TPA: hypothetical protein VGQ92_22465 [Actinoplanes sp.]|jgi:hypothetical protein|nr:hypothetical protein [Actinoplanes sp.]
MPVEIRIVGAEKFGILARALRQAADKDLQRELAAGLNRAAVPLRAEAKASALAVLPRRGGLAARVAGARLTTKRRGGRNPRVRIEAKGMPQLRRIDRGSVRHLVYGHPPFVTQHVTAGWFTKPMEAGAPRVRAQMVRVLDEIARKIAAAIR